MSSRSPTGQGGHRWKPELTQRPMFPSLRRKRLRAKRRAVRGCCCFFFFSIVDRAKIEANVRIPARAFAPMIARSLKIEKNKKRKETSQCPSLRSESLAPQARCFQGSPFKKSRRSDLLFWGQVGAEEPGAGPVGPTLPRPLSTAKPGTLHHANPDSPPSSWRVQEGRGALTLTAGTWVLRRCCRSSSCLDAGIAAAAAAAAVVGVGWRRQQLQVPALRCCFELWSASCEYCRHENGGRWESALHALSSLANSPSGLGRVFISIS